MNMKTVMAKVLLAGALGAGLPALAAEMTISEPTTLTEVQTDKTSPLWSPLSINADLTIDGGKLYEPYGAQVYLPGAADATASLVLTNGGRAEFYYPTAQHASKIVIGQNGGRGRIVLGANCGSATFNHIEIAANAEADESGYVDFMEFGSANGTMQFTDIIVNSEAPARLLFTSKGGTFRSTQQPTVEGALDIFRPSAGKRLVLWAAEGAAIRAYPNRAYEPAGFRMNSGEGVVETAGPGSFLAFAGTDRGFGAVLYLNGGPDKVQWHHAGDTVISNGITAVVTVDDALPCGSRTGDLVLAADPYGHSGLLDLAGHMAGVNGLRSSGDLSKDCGGVTNSSATVAVLEFGRGDMDGVCEITNVYDNITFRKVGGGTLAVRNTRVGTLEVTDGICLIGAGVKVDRVRVTGGWLELERGATLDCDDVTYSGSGAFRCATAGEAALSGGANLTDPLHVASGTCAVYDSDRDNKFWRFVIRGVHQGDYARAGVVIDTSTDAGNSPDGTTQDVYAALQRFHLFGYEGAKPDGGKRLNDNLAEAPVGTAAADLEPGQITSAKPYLTGRYDFSNGEYLGISSVGPSATSLAIGDWGKNIAWANAVPKKDDPSTWETLTMRLADGTAPVASFTYITSGRNPPTGNPTAANVECSADGVAWVVKYANDSMGNRHFNHPAYYPGGNVTSLTNNPHGAFNSCPSVEVAAGATLDLSAIPSENVLFNGLAIDLDRGAGTISLFVPAATGDFYLRTTNAVSLGVLANGPTFSEVGGTAKNVKKWKVWVNGVADDRLFFTITDDGRLSLNERRGAVMVIR